MSEEATGARRSESFEKHLQLQTVFDVKESAQCTQRRQFSAEICCYSYYINVIIQRKRGGENADIPHK